MKNLQQLLQNAIKLERLNKFLEALQLYKKIIQLDPKNPLNYNAVAVIFYKMGRYKDAIVAFSDAIILKPNYSEAYSNLGAIYAKLKDYNKAIQYYKKAITLKPKYAGAYTNLGNALNKIGEHEEAIHFHNIAISLDKSSANNFSNCASAYKNIGRFDRAENLYKKAINIDKNHVNAHFDLATVLLQQGKNAQGLTQYEWRFQKDEMQGHLNTYKEIFSRPLYQGQLLDNKRVLVHAEQGFGDAIMVARYLKNLKAKGAIVVLYLRDPLKELFEDLEYVDELFCRSQKIPNSDFQLPMMSLPIIFDKHLNFLTKNYPYFTNKKSYRLTSKKLKIGIVWGASNTGESYKNKVYDLRHFSQMAKHKKIQLYSLQMGNDAKDLIQYNLQDDIIDLSTHIKNFKDTLSIINSLDLVISSDTSVAHLAGAMGAKVWIVLQKVPDWRWGVDENISKWYPSAKLFRQYSLKDFNSVFRQIYLQLEKEYKIKVIDV